jgi:multidrug efflux pump subunit AcrA (membrane-fusion protein)
MEHKKREWVKNAAIIFLVIMLILTFFSNTIMNYSLPEVSSQYVSSGTLSEQIRGTATVEAAESYTVKISDTRVVKTVDVKAGDTVEKGQVLITLEEGDGAEVEAAETELDTAEETLYDKTIEYRKALLDAGKDYSVTELEIENLEEDIAKAKADLADEAADIDDYKLDYEDAQVKVGSAKDNVSKIKDEINKIKEKVSEITKEIKALEKEKSAYDEQLTALSSEDYSSLDESYYSRIKSANDNIDKYEQYKTDADEKVKNIQDEIGTSVSDLEITTKQNEVNKQTETVTQLQSKYNLALMDDSEDADELLSELNDAKYTLTNLNAELRDLISKKSSNSSAESKLTYALVSQSNAEKNYNSAQKNLDNIKLAISKEIKTKRAAVNDKIDAKNEELDDANSELESANEDLADANDELTQAESDESAAKDKAEKTTDEAESSIQAKERELEEKKLNLLQTQKSDLIDAGKSDIDIEVMQHNISEAEETVTKLQEKIAKLKKDASGGEITAQVAGVIESISPVAGETLESGSTVAVIQMTEKGYTASINCTIDQAKKVKVGDSADIQYFWYGDAEAVLTAIKSDSSSAQTKQLVFSVTGDVSPGMSLQLVMGGKGQQYDLIVPNSAIREDSNGKFVLKVVSKSSPLGNRYTAERVDVTVLASDDTKSAVTGELMQSDSIISTSSKPINAGDQVRFADN